MTRSPIGVFDSGVGGLSVLREIRAVLPGEDLCYVADSGAAPYGDRTEEFIKARSQSIARFFVDRGVKAIVVACNTATAVAVKDLRAEFAVTIIAMEPAVKPAAAITKSGVIGVLATSRTLASERFSRLAEQHAQGARVILQPCPGFVEQVEKGELESDVTRALVLRYVSPLVELGADTLVLGCTHYPFLIPMIQAVAGPYVRVIDPSIAVARQLERSLSAGHLLSPRDRAGSEQFWTSGSSALVQPVIAQLWGREVPVSPLASILR